MSKNALVIGLVLGIIVVGIYMMASSEDNSPTARTQLTTPVRSTPKARPKRKVVVPKKEESGLKQYKDTAKSFLKRNKLSIRLPAGFVYEAETTTVNGTNLYSLYGRHYAQGTRLNAYFYPRQIAESKILALASNSLKISKRGWVKSFSKKNLNGFEKVSVFVQEPGDERNIMSRASYLLLATIGRENWAVLYSGPFVQVSEKSQFSFETLFRSVRHAP